MYQKEDVGELSHLKESIMRAVSWEELMVGREELSLNAQMSRENVHEASCAMLIDQQEMSLYPQLHAHLLSQLAGQEGEVYLIEPMLLFHRLTMGTLLDLDTVKEIFKSVVF